MCASTGGIAAAQSCRILMLMVMRAEHPVCSSRGRGTSMILRTAKKNPFAPSRPSSGANGWRLFFLRGGCLEETTNNIPRGTW